MSGRRALAWTSLRALYEGAPVTIDILAQVAGLSSVSIQRRAEKEIWARTTASAKPKDQHQRIARQIERLETLVDRLIGEMEEGDNVMDKARTDMIGALLRAVEKLREMLPAPDESNEKEDVIERDRRIATLLERIDQRILQLAAEFAEDMVNSGTG